MKANPVGLIDYDLLHALSGAGDNHKRFSLANTRTLDRVRAAIGY